MTAIAFIIKRFVKKEISLIKSKTPKLWNWIAGVSAGVPVLLSAINLATSETVVPEWYTKYPFYILGAAAAIAYFAKRKTTNNGTT